MGTPYLKEFNHIVFTNGCFDVLHVGHLEVLKRCRDLAWELEYRDQSKRGLVYVGLNSDASVRSLKGDCRPIVPQKERREMLLALKYVDWVEIFEEETPSRLITDLGPDVIVKGGDYTKEHVIGYGISDVVIVPFVPGRSTTDIIKKVTSHYHVFGEKK